MTYKNILGHTLLSFWLVRLLFYGELARHTVSEGTYEGYFIPVHVIRSGLHILLRSVSTHRSAVSAKTEALSTRSCV